MSRRRQAAAGAPEGGLIVDKPAGPTSHDVVAAVRRALGQPRVGHTGTLDPMATGVLPLLLGRATRLAQFLTAGRKTYVATVRFGQATTTGDAAGEPVGPPATVRLDAIGLEAALASFRGRFAQTPPAVSAKKIGGRRAYDLARQSRPVTPAPVDVEVTELTLLACAGDLAELRVTASAGFYVRALADDLGAALGVGAHLTALRRERSGAFALADALTLDAVMRDPGAAASRLIPMAALLPDLPAVTLGDAAAARAAHGQALGPPDLDGPPPAGGSGLVRLLDDAGRLVGLGEARSGLLHPVLVLR